MAIPRMLPAISPYTAMLGLRPGQLSTYTNDVSQPHLHVLELCQQRLNDDHAVVCR